MFYSVDVSWDSGLANGACELNFKVQWKEDTESDFTQEDSITVQSLTSTTVAVSTHSLTTCSTTVPVSTRSLASTTVRSKFKVPSKTLDQSYRAKG